MNELVARILAEAAGGDAGKSKPLPRDNEPEKNAAAVKLGGRADSRAEEARAQSLIPEQRSKIARVGGIRAFEEVCRCAGGCG